MLLTPTLNHSSSSSRENKEELPPTNFHIHNGISIGKIAKIAKLFYGLKRHIKKWEAVRATVASVAWQ
jgi:hypothetical protein